MANRQPTRERAERVIDRAQSMAEGEAPPLLCWKDLRDRFGPRSIAVVRSPIRTQDRKGWWDLVMGRFD